MLNLKSNEIWIRKHEALIEVKFFW